jgi:membrane-bound lytic murein transglycosylase MltF
MNPIHRASAWPAIALLLASCGGAAPPPADAPPPAAAVTDAAIGAGEAVATRDAAESGAAGAPAAVALAPTPQIPSILDQMVAPHTGDLDEIIARRQVRVLTVINRTQLFFDGPTLRGPVADGIVEFERWLNEKLKTPKNLRIQAIVVPVRRDQLIGALREGRGDYVAAAMTVTPERQKLVRFAEDGFKVDEVVVLGKGAAPLASLEDLSGRPVHVRRSSSYYDSLVALDARLKAAGRKPLVIELVDEQLEDEDVLEMMNVGLIPATVVDDYKARLWQQVLPDIQVLADLKLRSGQLGQAVRQDSSQLAALLSEFNRAHAKGTLWGNTILKRYFSNADLIRNPTDEEGRQRLAELAGLFRKYGDRYSMDWMLMAAQAYQESRLDHGAKSRVGAIGIMQLMPGTARDPNVNVGDVQLLENNIHAGVKYMRFVIDQYYKDEPMTKLDKGLFALASYNAGPARVAKLRREAASAGLDPNVWFQNVEIVAARRIGAETVTYARNIYKYYLTYKLVQQQAASNKTGASPGTGGRA